MTSIFNLLKENGLEIGEPGKGRAAWIAYGYILAEGKSEVIVSMNVISLRTAANSSHVYAIR